MTAAIGSFFIATMSGLSYSAKAADSDVSSLKNYIVKTIGNAPAKRKEISKKTLNTINPLKGGELLELAALGTLARESSTREALAEDIPKRSKNLIETVLRDKPQLGWVHAMAGAWHFEIVRRSKIAAVLLGAGRKEGREHFNKARSKAPNDGGVFLLEAISLIYDGKKKQLPNIQNLLTSAERKAKLDKSDYGAQVQKYALLLLKKSKQGDIDSLKTSTRAIY